MPGDRLQPRAQFQCTRAITIDAPPEAVWPWLVQAGCLRGGFYSNDLLDNLGHPSAREVVAELQHLEVGQWVPMSPTTPSDTTALKVDGFEVNRWLLWRKPDSTWAWTLTEPGHGKTRLVTRIHARYDWRRPASALFGVVLMELGDFAMMRRMLHGIKERSEALVKATWFDASTMDTALPTADSMSGRESDMTTADAARLSDQVVPRRQACTQEAS